MSLILCHRFLLQPVFRLAQGFRIGDLNEDGYRSMSKIGAVDVIGMRSLIHVGGISNGG